MIKPVKDSNFLFGIPVGMKIETFKLGDLETNCYLLYSNKEAIVIDPADDGVFIADEIHLRGLKLKAVIATHGHFDHNLGVGELQMILPAPFYLHQKDKFLVDDINKSGKFWLKREIKNPHPTDICFLKGGDKISFGKCELKVLDTPGHTPGSVSLYNNDNGCRRLFSGDTLFRGGIGRYDFSYSSKDDLKNSIKMLFNKLPPEIIVYPGHGEETNLLNEQFFYRWASN